MILCLVCQIIALFKHQMLSSSHYSSAESFHIFLSVYSYCTFWHFAILYIPQELVAIDVFILVSNHLSSTTFSIYTALFIHLAKHSTFNCFSINLTGGKNPNHSVLQYYIKTTINGGTFNLSCTKLRPDNSCAKLRVLGRGEQLLYCAHENISLKKPCCWAVKCSLRTCHIQQGNMISSPCSNRVFLTSRRQLTALWWTRRSGGECPYGCLNYRRVLLDKPLKKKKKVSLPYKVLCAVLLA